MVSRAGVLALQGDVREHARMLERLGARVALVQMEAPRNMGRDYTARFHDAFPAAARAAGVPLLPFLLDGVAGDPALNQPDGVHPTAAGARRVADNVWKGLAPLLPAGASAGGAARVAGRG